MAEPSQLMEARIRAEQNYDSSQRPDQSNQEDTMGFSDREYEFFVTTDKPHQPEGTDRGLIRRTVMRNFFESKWAGSQNNTSEHNSASTVMAERQLKSRFRLPKPGKESPESTMKRRDSNQEKMAVKRKRPKATRTGSGATDANEQAEARKSLTGSPPGPSTDENNESSKTGKRQDQRILLKISPSSHRFDPFDVLPVPGTPQLDMLFKLYKSGSRTNSIVINAKHTWWSFISNDAGLLHATLATWALYGVLVRGLSELRVDKLRHKNEAIKEINVKLGSPDSTITDELVGTVLTMASFENLLGAYESAQVHVAALKRMVNARGGIFAFGHNDGLIRGITWVDFHTAAAFHMPPSFPQIRLDPDAPPLPDKVLEKAALTSPTSLLQLSMAAIDCFNIFYRLHRLAIAASSYWRSQVNPLTLSNLLYETEYIILSVPDCSRDFLDFDLETKPERDKDLQDRDNTAHAASVVEALLAAAQIFVYAALRELPTNAKIFAILLERLRIAVARPSICTIYVWKKERQLHMLLWTFVVACSVAPAGECRSWWIERLTDIIVDMKIRSRFDLEMVLQRVAWVDTYFNSVLGAMWEEVAQQ
ncbi:hypothetical protein FB567DRAFT_528483 [Paraphoma chrysanthemicola]|uniref:Tachykinin family protein n=1 Tax=Paraphoma chrysanthemicola TaxID=798071 RepID=A0A8K0R581_9PLEO|nr:hypothetical protein FB567DRAFT_528483 [Paraphoma chrysanthemicola]